MANELILAWLPDKPGLAVGLSTFSLELGIMAFSGIFHELIAWLNVVNAIAVSAAFSSVTALFLALTLQWPEEGDVPEEEDADSSDDGSLTLLDTPCGDKKVTWRELFQDYVFWFYLVGVFSTSAAHVFEIYFFKLGSVFGRSTSEVLWLFQVTRVLSMFIGFCGNTWAPSLSGNGRYLFSGAKNVMGSLLGLQALLFACLIPCSIYGNFIAFIMLVAVFDMIASVHSGSLILVAKDLFGKRNITFVFGIGAGLVSCWGEGLSVWLMSILERAATVDDGTSTPSDYNYFYKVGCLWCFSGCLCTFLAVNRCDDQQPREKSFSNGSSKI